MALLRQQIFKMEAAAYEADGVIAEAWSQIKEADELLNRLERYRAAAASKLARGDAKISPAVNTPSAGTQGLARGCGI
jgi:hypothetical protein